MTYFEYIYGGYIYGKAESNVYNIVLCLFFANLLFFLYFIYIILKCKTRTSFINVFKKIITDNNELPIIVNKKEFLLINSYLGLLCSISPILLVYISKFLNFTVIQLYITQIFFILCISLILCLFWYTIEPVITIIMILLVFCLTYIDSLHAPKILILSTIFFILVYFWIMCKSHYIGRLGFVIIKFIHCVCFIYLILCKYIVLPNVLNGYIFIFVFTIIPIIIANNSYIMNGLTGNTTDTLIDFKILNKK